MSYVRIASLVLLLLLEGIINCPKWLSLNNETMSQFIGPGDMLLRKPIFPKGPWPNWPNGKYATADITHEL